MKPVVATFISLGILITVFCLYLSNTSKPDIQIDKTSGFVGGQAGGGGGGGGGSTD